MPPCRPSTFLALACMCALALPVQALARSAGPAAHRPLVVVLDPGHGGEDTGAADASGTEVEKALTLRVARRAAADLRRMGYRVYLTRTRDQSPNTPAHDLNHDGHINHVDDLDARTLFANRHHASVFVSIHFDASDDPSIHGTHGYYCPDRPFWRQNQRLARLLTAAVPAALAHAHYYSPNNGVQTDVADVVPQTRANYPWFLVLGPSAHHFVTGTAMPGALIETLYLSSPRDAAALHHGSVVAALGDGYAAGIRSYFHGRTQH